MIFDLKIDIMKNITFILALLFTTFGFSQNTGELVIFSNLGDPFYVILNGEKQNQKAETNVKVQNLTPGFYSCKVISENNLYSFDKNFEIKLNFLTTYRIIEKSGVPKMRYFSEIAMSSGQQTTSGQTVIVYHPAPVANTTTTETVQTTTTTSPTNGTVETINVGIQISENGVNTTISETDLSTQGNVSQTTTVTTTTTSSSTSNNTTNNQPVPTNSYCLVDNNGMTKVVSLVKEESFSENKLNVAKQFTRNKCLTVNQIKEIGKLFSFSADKMEYVKYAYDYCLNTNDYYELNELFTFSDDKNTLNGFINSK